MKISIWTVLGGLTACLLETSLAPVPFVMLYLWVMMETVSIESVLWLSFALGLIVDSLALRNLGISSLLLLSFVAGAYILRRVFSGVVVVEWFFLLLGIFVWEWIFVKGISVWMVIFWLIVCLVLEIRKRLVTHQDIKLR